MSKIVLAVDLGGTNVRCSAMNDDGLIPGTRFQAPSHAQEGEAKVLNALYEVMTQSAAASPEPPIAAGLSVPGHVDAATGVVRWSPNFGENVDGIWRYWSNVEVGKPLADRLGIPCFLNNDANLAALGEYWFGTGRGTANGLVMLTLGTGIGGGVILNPRTVIGNCQGPLILVGANQGGAELGHIFPLHGGMEGSDGTYGCLEAYCGRDAIIRRLVNRLKRGRSSILRDRDWATLTPKDMTQACEQGDELAIEVFREIGEWLGAGMGSLINVFAPEIFALGGQISKAGKWILDPAVNTARNCAIETLFQDTTITLAEQIEDAGILGAGKLALSMV